MVAAGECEGGTDEGLAEFKRACCHGRRALLKQEYREFWAGYEPRQQGTAPAGFQKCTLSESPPLSVTQSLASSGDTGRDGMASICVL